MAVPVFAYAKLRPLRQAKGLNQGEIAAELGISRPTYVLMEQGQREPTLSQLYTLARLLGVEINELGNNLPSQALYQSNYAKLKELVFACASAGSENGSITKTKLSLLTYLTDFSRYKLEGRPITGALYRHTARGPVADDFFRAIDELYEGQSIAIEPTGVSLIIRPIERAQPTLLSPDELLLVEKICTKWRKESTEAVMRFTSMQSPFKTSIPGEPIAYESILATPKDLLY
jgi:transcriptional regulator with XRE-family HTH domain